MYKYSLAKHLPIILTLGILAACLFNFTYLYQCRSGYCITYHFKILSGEMQSPWVYRILPAYLVEQIRLLTQSSISDAYLYAHALVMPLLYLLLYIWFNQQMDSNRALVGILITSAYWPLMIWKPYAIQISTPLECLFFVCALILMTTNSIRGKHFLLAVIIIFATMNRATAVIIPLAFMVLHGWRYRGLTIIYFLIWISVFVGLRGMIGLNPPLVPISEVWQTNTGKVAIDVLKTHFFFLPLWYGVILNWRKSTTTIKHLSLILIPYFLSLMVFSIWNEVRLLLPIFPIMLVINLQKGANFEKNDNIL